MLRRDFLGALALPMLGVRAGLPKSPPLASPDHPPFGEILHVHVNDQFPRRESIVVELDGEIVRHCYEADVRAGVARLHDPRLGDHELRGRVGIRFRDHEARDEHYRFLGIRGIDVPPVDWTLDEADLDALSIMGVDIVVHTKGYPLTRCCYANRNGEILWRPEDYEADVNKYGTGPSIHTKRGHHWAASMENVVVGFGSAEARARYRELIARCEAAIKRIMEIR